MTENEIAKQIVDAALKIHRDQICRGYRSGSL
jgi:hypothetical protein